MSSSPPPLPEERTDSLPPLRFSLRTMLIGTTAFAVFFALEVLLPNAPSKILVGALWLAVTGWLLTGLVFGRGDQRAFCLGALLVITSMWTGIGGMFMDGFHRLIGRDFVIVSIYVDFLIICLTAAANGWLCVKARRVFVGESSLVAGGEPSEQ